MIQQGRVALVTGAGQGLGRAIAERLAREGARVAVNDLVPEAAETVARAIGEAGGEAAACPGDVSREDGARAVVGKTLGCWGRLDILVNNAGILRDNLLANVSTEEWDLVLQVNLRSQFLCCRTVVPAMRDAGYGRIVNLASRAWLGGVGQVSYAASKGGVVSLTRTLALELARFGITVNAVAPGVIETPLIQNLREDVRERLRLAQPGGAFGKPEDVAHAVAFFAAEESGFITGQVLYVCGGKSVASYT